MKELLVADLASRENREITGFFVAGFKQVRTGRDGGAQRIGIAIVTDDRCARGVRAQREAANEQRLAVDASSRPATW